MCGNDSGYGAAAHLTSFLSYIHGGVSDRVMTYVTICEFYEEGE